MTATWGSRATARLLLATCLVAGLTACRGTRKLMDPILEVRTPGGQELGVATDFGVLFLGRTAARFGVLDLDLSPEEHGVRGRREIGDAQEVVAVAAQHEEAVVVLEKQLGGVEERDA